MSTRSVLCLLAAAALAAVAAAEHKLPAAWSTCKASDPNLNKCLKPAIEKAFKELEKGSPELGIPALEPLKVGMFRLQRGGNGPLNIDMTFTDAKMSGASKASIESTSLDLAKGQWVIRMMVPTLTVDSNYKVRGRVLVIPINGNGHANIKMENAMIKLTMKGRKEKRGQKDFFKLNALEFDVMPQKTIFKFVNPEPGHVQQAELLSRVVTENDKSIMQEMRPTISSSFGKHIRDIIAPAFDVPFDDLFPH